MAEAAPPAPSIDPRSGFCAETRTFHSLRSPPTRLPPHSLSVSFPSFLFSFLPSPLPSHPAFLDPSTHDSISFPSLLSNVRSLSFALRPKISKGDVALVVSPPRLDLPLLYLSLLSLGAVVSPVNPVSTSSEISRLVELSSPSLAFATSSTAPKFPPDLPLVLLDSPHFQSLLNADSGVHIPEDEDIRQSDTAAIMYSSGTSGLVKGVALSHRNLIAQVAPFASEPATRPAPVLMITVPLFHVYGFVFCLKSVAAGETAVISSARFDAGRTLEAISQFRVTNLALAPPGVLALVGAREKEQAAKKSRSDVSSVKAASCGGAPIGTDLIRRFLAAFPHAQLAQGYGMTESTGGAFRSESPEENQRLGSVGRLVWGMEAKIVDPVTGVALSPTMQGELWIRGPTIMQGYIGDELSTSAILNSEGWLRTGDLCFIDEDGFLVLLDRLKELIKYKGYQAGICWFVYYGGKYGRKEIEEYSNKRLSFLQVAPAELESLLQTHPDIIEAAVVPYPDEQAGQIPVAFVLRKPHSILNEAQIIEFVGKQVAPYKKIRRVIFVNSIQKNAAGKILRKDLPKLAFPVTNSKM